MNKHHPYNSIIERKLEQLPAPDADLLWADMHSILDENMPQKKDRRRFIWWIFNDKGLLLMAVGIFMIIGSSLFFVSAKENSPIASNNLFTSQQTNKLIEGAAGKGTPSNEKNITGEIESKQKMEDDLAVTSSSNSVVDHMVNNFINREAKKEFAENTAYAPFNQSVKNEFNQPINDDSKGRENSPIDLVDLNSTHINLHITPNHNRQEFSLTQPLDINKGRNIEKGFYVGIMIGSDFSSVGFQSAKAGATTGFILGYTLNQNWSIESGLLWDTKRVYDNGTYFNPPGYTPTNGIKIVAVNGKSRLHEWPVNIKYSIKSGAHSFFATTGVSSYFMKLENYDYEYTQNNQPGGHNYLSYKKETKDWFGVANFSVGYSHKIGNNGNIRIEPYLKLPVTNIGTANMPIMSAGLNIGITKPLRR